MSIILKNIKKEYDNQIIINNVSLEVFDGELFVLLGSSGSGKSSLLRVISGLIQPDSGIVEINNKDVTNLLPQERKTGFVFQNYSVFRHMTVRDNVEFGLKIRGIAATERRKKAAQFIELVGLTGLESRYADQLSGGQQQRVALARALVYEPAVLLLDEPFGALDVKIRSQLRRSLKEIQREVKVTTILVTHDQEEAFELADRIAIINHGQIVEVNTSKKLYFTPKHEYTAAFIGSGNVLLGKKEKSVIRLGSSVIPFPESAPQHDENSPVRVLFRPEFVILQSDRLDITDTMFYLGEGKVKDIKFGGTHRKITVNVEELSGTQQLYPQSDFGQRSVRVEALQTSSDYEYEQLKIGQKVFVAIKNYHILNPAGLKMLIYYDKGYSEPEQAWFALRLAERSGGTAMLLSVVYDTEDQSDVLKQLEDIRKDSGISLSVSGSSVRAGHYDEEILKEAQEGQYELIVVNYNNKNFSSTLKIISLLLSLKLPVLLVKNPEADIKNILICTAAGEPGKDDIRYGARVSKLINGYATLFHVIHSDESAEDKKRAEEHLKRGLANLQSLNVKGDYITREGASPVNEINKETSNGKYELIVIGSPSPRGHNRLFWSDLTYELINKIKIPILIVPMISR